MSGPAMRRRDVRCDVWDATGFLHATGSFVFPLLMVARVVPGTGCLRVGVSSGGDYER